MFANGFLQKDKNRLFFRPIELAVLPILLSVSLLNDRSCSSAVHFFPTQGFLILVKWLAPLILIPLNDIQSLSPFFLAQKSSVPFENLGILYFSVNLLFFFTLFQELATTVIHMNFQVIVCTKKH